MKRTIATLVVFAVASLGAATQASAQAGAFSANVPFGFTVGNRFLPIGEYQIVPCANSPEVLIKSKNQEVVAFALGFQTDGPLDGQSKLIFDQVGDQYFSRELCCR